MEIQVINKTFAVCKISSIRNIKQDDEFYFLSKTDDEISLVCEESSIPADHTECKKGWKAFKIKGVLDFSMVGVLSKISTMLAENSISIFAISTYNTDYILVKSEDMDNAIKVLNKAYTITR